MTYSENTEYLLDVMKRLLAVDSPTGFTQKATEFTVKELEALGFASSVTNKGSVLADIGGEGDPVIVTAHLDTIGAIVSRVKDNGRLKISNIGGMKASNCETENVRIYARNGKVYEGCLQLLEPSVHVNRNVADQERSFETTEIVIDEDVRNKADTLALGITNGCYVCFDPRTVITSSGYLKSRYLDDKLADAILLALAKKVSEGTVKLNRKTYLFFTTYEEVGHGGKGGLPADAEEILAVDMGCVGTELDGSERKVSICAKDAHGPYDYEVTAKLIRLAEENGLQYAVDVYLSYSSDAQAAVQAGLDLRHALIGPGVYASHGYERSHVEGAENTLKLLEAYLQK
ncbi:MAG: M42 family metallopeptidase [Solobacterium sp.]|nr:M42 family metallopeptidase [Solobacterium sp.]